MPWKMTDTVNFFTIFILNMLKYCRFGLSENLNRLYNTYLYKDSGNCWFMYMCTWISFVRKEFQKMEEQSKGKVVYSPVKIISLKILYGGGNWSILRKSLRQANCLRFCPNQIGFKSRQTEMLWYPYHQRIYMHALAF